MVINLIVDAIEGPVVMSIEAYIVDGMKVPFIIGNDFARQYRLSIQRKDSSTKVIFGSTGQSIDAIESTLNPKTDDAGNVFSVYTRPDFKTNLECCFFRRKKSHKKQTVKDAPEGSMPVYLAPSIEIKPDSMLSVPIQVQFAPEQSEGFIGRSLVGQKGNTDLYGLTDCIVDCNTKSIQMANSSQNFVKLPKGHIIGYMRSPDKCLNKPSELDDDCIKAGQAKANLIISLIKQEKVPTPTEEEIKLSEPVEGGPKTSKVPDYDPIPKDKLLTEMHFGENLTPDQRRRIEQIVLDKYSAFGLDGPLGNYPADVEIKLRSGTKEISMAPYSASPAKREVIDKQVDDWLRLEVIESSKSAWGFPVLIVYRNNKPRLCIDYRRLNEVAIPDEYPLPKQIDILHALEGSQYLTTLDALAGFTELKIEEEDRPKTVFRCHRGLFQFKRLPFGFRNGPAVFQGVMTDVLAPYLWIFALVYIVSHP